MNNDIIEDLNNFADVHSITIEIPLENNIENISIDWNSDTTIIIIKNTYYIVNENGKILGYYYEDEVEKMSNFYEDLAIIKENNSWYYIDKSGNIVIDCSDYNDIQLFSEGLARVKKNNSWYFIDKSGNIVIDCSKYDEVYSFFEGLVRVKKNDSWYFIDKSGNIVIDCSEYDEVYSFSEGLARVKKNETWYLINKSGDIELTCGEFKIISDFKNGYFIAANDNQIYCYDKQGDIINLHNNLKLFHYGYDIDFYRGKKFTAIRHSDNITFLSHYRFNQTIPKAFDHLTITKEFKNLDEFATYTEQLPSNWKISSYAIGINKDGKIDYTNAAKAIKNLEIYTKAMAILFKERKHKQIEERKPKQIEERKPKQVEEKIENETSSQEKQNLKNSSEYIKSFIERIQKNSFIRKMLLAYYVQIFLLIKK